MAHRAWRAGLAGVLALALAALQAFPTGATRQQAGITALVPATRVIIFHPKGTRGAPVAGSCDMGESQALDRADAWRCIVGNNIYDPCFSAAPHAGSVICDVSPDRPIGTRVMLARPLPTHAPAHGQQAWILLLGDGSRCAFITGATFGVRGQRANYGCSDKGWVLGNPAPGRVWYAVKALLADKPGPNGPVAARIWAVSVATVWE